MTMARHYCDKCGGEMPSECDGECEIPYRATRLIRRLRDERDAFEAEVERLRRCLAGIRILSGDDGDPAWPPGRVVAEIHDRVKRALLGEED